MTTFTLADIRRLLDAFEQSDWDEIHLVADGMDVHIASHEVAVSASPAAIIHAPSAAVPIPAVAAPAPPAPPDPTPAPDPTAPPAPPGPTATDGDGATAVAAAERSSPPPAADAEVDGAHAVVSPSPGIFWRSPAPGEPPFVEVGQKITPTTPVGIVEVMKLMNQVLAGVAGTVTAVLVENGARVDRNEPMVLVAPDA